MPRELEQLAQQLVKSGRLRIDADEMSNFVRFSNPSYRINVVFSYRELQDPDLIPRTTSIVRSVLALRYSGKELEERTSYEIERLRHDVTKILGVDDKTEMRLARAIVQAAHPSVIMLLLAEGAELFISYSHTVGDMLDIQSWQQVGTSSGLQSSGYMENAVFVSCGGNPFLHGDKKRYESDGDDALARMVVIGGQELGHFADIIRDKKGRKTSRVSANIYATRAKPQVREGRINDMHHTDEIRKKLRNMKIDEVAEFERHLKFFRKQKRGGFTKANALRRVNNGQRRLIRRIKAAKLHPLLNIPPYDEPYLASKILAMAFDMRFNLEPKADAYSRPDPIEEEAIACVEALARVPQQVNKWGHKITHLLTPALYDIYYHQVIPGCIEAYENISGNKYHFHITPKSKLEKIIGKIFGKGRV